MSTLPKNISQTLRQLDAERGFPPGLMESILIQETSGKPEYINDPTRPHYAPDKRGRRKSSAFGPFGLLEGTAADPGFGVAPLKDKADFAEHARFAADYLKARINSFGGLAEGIKMYGTGEDTYAQAVLGRLGHAVAPEPANRVNQPTMAAIELAPETPVAQAQVPAPTQAGTQVPAWTGFQQAMVRPQGRGNPPAPQVRAEDLAFGSQALQAAAQQAGQVAQGMIGQLNQGSNRPLASSMASWGWV